jgi:hypothetical protein
MMKRRVGCAIALMILARASNRAWVLLYNQAAKDRQGYFVCVHASEGEAVS